MTKTLMAVLAHPDDESFGLGGTLALYAQKGFDVYYLCATRGEAGDVEPKYMEGFQDVAAMRTVELEKAAAALGLKQVIFLGYRDSGMPGMEANRHPDAQINHPVQEVADRVMRHIRAIKPDVVLTFDPIGGYKHPDHIHIHQATVLAFKQAADPAYDPQAGAPFQPEALYYQVFPRRLLRIVTRIMPLFGKDPTKFGRNGDINMKELAEVDFPVHVRLDVTPVSDAKRRASEAHASQGGMQMRRGVMGFLMRFMGEHEDYMRAFPPVPEDGSFKRRKDLFDL